MTALRLTAILAADALDPSIASGSGKSSLLRAGLPPGVMRPGAVKDRKWRNVAVGNPCRQ